MSLAELSQQVLLDVAACVPDGDSRTTGDLLYHSNWLPLSPHWLSGVTDEAAVRDFVTGGLGFARPGWVCDRDRSWTYWHNVLTARPGTSRFKVYLSVLPDAVPVAFDRAVTVYAAGGVPSFKLSRHPRGLLRPDRMVAYCTSEGAASELADRLAAVVSDLPAHGVPFTCAPLGQTAVSWARDPDPPAAAYGGSWRRWVTAKLAGYLHASDDPTASGRADFALAHLDSDGVDTSRWLPRAVQ